MRCGNTLFLLLSGLTVMVSGTCVPYNGTHLNESAWEANVQEQAQLNALICADMTPRRCDPKQLVYIQPQMSAILYNVTVSPNPVARNATLQATFCVAGGFRSLYVQARAGNTPMGQFLRDASTFPTTCPGGENNTALFKNIDLVPCATLTWVAPDVQTTVVLRATMSQTFDKFWVGLESEAVTVSNGVESTSRALGGVAVSVGLLSLFNRL